MHTNVLPQVETRVRALLICGLLLCGFILGALLINLDGAHANQALSAPKAHASKVEAVNVKLDFEITQVKGDVILAKGRSLGAVSGNASLHLTLVNASHAIAEIYAYNKNGTIHGVGAAGYHAAGGVSYFSGGKPPALRGTGKYKGLKSLTMKLTGTMNRRTLKISVQLKGKWDV